MGIGFGNTGYGGGQGSLYGAYDPWANEYQQALNQMIAKAGQTATIGGGSGVETPQYAAQHNNGGSVGVGATGNGFGTQAGYTPLPAYQLYQLNNQAESYLPSDLQIDQNAMSNAGTTASDQYMRNVVNPSVANSLEQSAAAGSGNSTFAAATAAALQSNGAAQAQQVNNDAQNAYANRVEGLRSSYFQGAGNTPNTSATNYNQFGIDQLNNNVAQGQLGVSQGQLGVDQGKLGLAQQAQNYSQYDTNRQFGLKQNTAIGTTVGNLFGF